MAFCSLFPVPCSLFSNPYSLLLTPRDTFCISCRCHTGKDRCGPPCRPSVRCAVSLASPPPCRLAAASSFSFLRWNSFSSSSMVVEGLRVVISISRGAPSPAIGRAALATGGAFGTGPRGRGAASIGWPSDPRICIRKRNRTVSSWNFAIIASNISNDSRLYSTSGSFCA